MSDTVTILVQRDPGADLALPLPEYQTAGAAGAGLAALMLAALRLIGGEGGLTPALPLAWVDLLVLIACPLLAGAVAVLAARLTALAKLGQRS